MTQGLWRAQILAGDADEPLAQSQALVDRDATAANRLDHALLLLAAQRDAAAISQLEDLTRDPESAAVALRLLGLVEFQAGKLDAAGRRFTELLAMGKFLDDCLLLPGIDRGSRWRRAARAAAVCASAERRQCGACAAARCSILQATVLRRRLEELFDRLVEDAPERAPEILAARARIYADAGDEQRAMHVLDGGEREYPDSVEMRYAIASTYEEQGRIGPALRELKIVLDSRPDDPAALNAYGYTLADHKLQLGHARTLIERAHATAPKNAAILDSLGWVLFRQGHSAEALPYLTGAYADDRGGDIAAHLGEVLWSLGRRDEAERVWSEAGAVDSDNRLLKATRATAARLEMIGTRRLIGCLCCSAILAGCATIRPATAPAAMGSAPARFAAREQVAARRARGRGVGAAGLAGQLGLAAARR